MMNQMTAKLRKTTPTVPVHTTYCNFKYLKIAIQKFTDCYTKNDFAMQILFLHRTFDMQNFLTKSFPAHVYCKSMLCSFVV